MGQLISRPKSIHTHLHNRCKTDSAQPSNKTSSIILAKINGNRLGLKARLNYLMNQSKNIQRTTNSKTAPIKHKEIKS